MNEGRRLPGWLPARAPSLPRLPGGLRPWISLVSLGFVMAALLSHGRQLLQFRLDPQGWLWLALAVGTSLLSLVANGVALGVVLRWLGHRPRWEPLVALYLATNLRKYLPGGIWHLASRVQALRTGEGGVTAPMRTGLSLVAVLLDPLLAATAALALVPLAGWQRGLGLVCLVPLALLQPRWLAPLLQRLERRRARDLGLEEELEREGPNAPAPMAVRRYPWPPLLAELTFVLLRFAGFACCVLAFDLQNSLDWPSWLAGFALAWTAGLVVPGAPGGLGVFEAVLLLRLGVALPEPPLLAVALSYRLVVTIADLLAAGVVALDQKLASRLDGASSQ
jgi:glycosyltransferase 2 family protein